MMTSEKATADALKERVFSAKKLVLEKLREELQKGKAEACKAFAIKTVTEGTSVTSNHPWPVGEISWY